MANPSRQSCEQRLFTPLAVSRHTWRIQVGAQARAAIDAGARNSAADAAARRPRTPPPSPPKQRRARRRGGDAGAPHFEPLLTTPHTARQGGVAFSGDGETLAIAGEHAVTLLYHYYYYYCYYYYNYY